MIEACMEIAKKAYDAATLSNYGKEMFCLFIQNTTGELIYLQTDGSNGVHPHFSLWKSGVKWNVKDSRNTLKCKERDVVKALSNMIRKELISRNTKHF